MSVVEWIFPYEIHFDFPLSMGSKCLDMRFSSKEL